MMDRETVAKLAELRRQIDDAQKTCGAALDAMSRARSHAAGMAATTPFLADCAKDLDALAGVVRLAAERAGADTDREAA